jgi:hypothetical protein
MEIVKAKYGLEITPVAAHRKVVHAATSLKIIEANDPLLDAIYEKLIAPYFPRDDRDECQAIRNYLAQNDANREKKIRYYVVAALRKGALVGTTIFSFVGGSRFCMMNGQYTSVLPEERRQHLAQTLSEHRVKVARAAARDFGYRTLDLSVITLATAQNNPDDSNGAHSSNGSNGAHSSNGSNGSNGSNSSNGSNGSNGSHAFVVSPDPTMLRKIWHSFGHDWVDFPFVQLPIADGKKALRALLGVKRHSSKYIQREHLTKDEMKCIIDACNYFRVSQAPNESYPEYQEMLNFLERNPEISIG